MNNYDLTVGDGVFGDDQNPSGMFNYVQRNEPTVGMAVGGDVESQLRRVLDPEGLEQAPEFAPQQAVDAAFDLALNKQAPQPADVIQNLQQAGAQEVPSNSLFDNRIARPLSSGLSVQSAQTDSPSQTTASTTQPTQTASASAPSSASQIPVPDWAKTLQSKFSAPAIGPTGAPMPQGALGSYGNLYDAFAADFQSKYNEINPSYPPELKAYLASQSLKDRLAKYGVSNPEELKAFKINTTDKGVVSVYSPNGQVIEQFYDDLLDTGPSNAQFLAQYALMVATMGYPGAATAIGQAAGLSGTAATAFGNAALSTAGAAAGGAKGSDLLKAAAIGAAGTYAKEFAGTAGKAAGSFVTNLFPETAAWDTASNLAGDVAAGAVKGGISALPGAIATGDASGILTGGIMGGAGGAFSNLTEGLTSYGIKPSQIQAGINIARGLQSGNTSAVLNSLGGLLDSRNVDIAAKAFIAYNAINNNEPIKAAAAIVQLHNVFDSNALKSFKSPPSSQTTSQTDIDNLNNVFASLGSDEEETFAELTDEEAENLLSFLNKPPTQEGQDQVVISGSKIPVGDQFLDSLLSENYFTATPKPLTQSVSVTGKYMTNASEPGYLYDPTDVTAPSERVPVTGERLKYLTSTGDPAYLDKPADPALQSVSVTGKLLPPELIELEGIDIPEPFVPKEVPKAEEIKTPPKEPITIPKAPSSPKQTAPQQALAGRQEELTSLGALPLFESVFYEQRMREQQLADLLEQEENQDPYEVLMRMAERNPEVAVDELMRIIEGA